MQHDPGVVRKAPLFLAAALTDMMGATVIAVCRRVCRIGTTLATPDSKPLVTTIAACTRMVMVLSEYLRYVLAGDRPDGAAGLLRHGVLLALISLTRAGMSGLGLRRRIIVIEASHLLPRSQLLASVGTCRGERPLLQTITDWEALTALKPMRGHDGVVMAWLMTMSSTMMHGWRAREMIDTNVPLDSDTIG